jgi:putative DNA primase/helicase
MPSQMTALDPAPEVVFADPWRLLGMEAGRYAHGLSSTVHLCQGQRRVRARITHLGCPDDVEACVKSFAFSAGVSEEVMRQALLDLMGGIEEALRRQEEDARRARDDRTRPKASLDPAAGGFSIRTRFHVQPDGVWYHEPPDTIGITPPPFWVCAELRIVGATRDEHNDNHGHALEFRDRHGQLQRWAMPLETLEDRREYRRVLRRLGLLMNSSKQGVDLLQLYLDLCHAQAKMVCVEKTGWHHDVYVLPDGAFGQRPDDEQVVLQGLEHTVDGYRQVGTLQEWQEKVACLCVGNSRLLLACSMGFAAALLTPLGVEGGGIHLRGPSSEGKTTAAFVGASVWGEPGRVEHWRATANGLEGVAAAHNDNLLLLDELKEIDPREAGATAYMLANGSGKRRGRPEGGTRPRLTWTVLFLSTGEISLAQHVEQVGHRVHAGQEVRLIDLPADAGQGHGVFEHLHDHESAQVFADALRRHVHAAHGTSGRMFVAALVQDMPQALEQVRKVCEAFMTQVPTAATGQVRRVAGRFALIGAAGELATAAGITGWEAGVAVGAAATCFNNWLQQRGTLTNADEARAVAQVRLFFERYGEARFTPWTVADETTCPRCHGTGHHATGDCFHCHGSGTLEPRSPNGHVHDRAGFRKETADGRTEYFVIYQPCNLLKSLSRIFVSQRTAARCAGHSV